MDTKKLGAALLTGVLAASMLAGCGSDKKDTATTSLFRASSPSFNKVTWILPPRA